jgi:hypothetical protein
LDRLDSVTWSERDWLDSGDESDEERSGSGGKNKGGGFGMPFGGERSSSPLMWNWTEKIVGKGAARLKAAGGGGSGGEVGKK